MALSDSVWVKHTSCMFQYCLIHNSETKLTKYKAVIKWMSNKLYLLYYYIKTHMPMDHQNANSLIYNKNEFWIINDTILFP